MKTLRNFLLLLLALFVVSGVGGYFYMKKKFAPPANELTVAGLPATGTLRWLADSSAQPVVPRTVLLVPVSVPGCPRTCFLQFDTGAPYTVFYQHQLVALGQRYPAVLPALQPQADGLHDVRFGLGGAAVTLRRAKVIVNGAAELPADTTRPYVIGTLGTDVIDGRVLVLDYARNQFSLSNQVPQDLSNRADFAPLSFDSRRVLFEASVEGKSEQMMFDTGTSAFALLTSQDHWQELAQPTAPVRTIPVNSWGKTLTAHTAPTSTTLGVGAAALPLGSVTYMEGTSFMQQALMRFSGMGGMLGNEPFATRAVILDVAGGRFGVVR